MIVVFSETNETITATALADDAQHWQEQVPKSRLALWLKQAHDEGRLRRQDTLLLLLPETALVRRVLTLGTVGRPSQQRAMAAHALTAELGEHPAALSLMPMGAERWAACGCGNQALAQRLAPFGGYSRRVQLIGVADWAVACAASLDDGYYIIQDLLWTAVVAVSGGCVVDGRAENGGNVYALEQALRKSHEESGLSLSEARAAALPVLLTNSCDGARLLRTTLRRARSLSWASLGRDRVMLALAFFCLVLPGVLLLALMLRPAEPAQEDTAAHLPAVVRSNYDALLSQAYTVRDARITLLSQEAREDALAITGRCSEVLDLAAYMRALAEAEPALHPLLLETTRMSEDEQTYYEFVVQISLEGDEGA